MAGATSEMELLVKLYEQLVGKEQTLGRVWPSRVSIMR